MNKLARPFFIVAVMLCTVLTSCAPARPSSPIAVVQAAYDRIDAGDLDGTMVFFANNALVTDPINRVQGSEAIRKYFEGEISGGERFELSDLTADGNVVTYTLKVYHGDSLLDTVQGLDVVKDGRIVFDGSVDVYRNECGRDPAQAFCAGP